MSSKTRREFLMTTGLGVAAGMLAPSVGGALGTQRSSASGSGSGSPTAAAFRIRRNVASAEAQADLASLRVGVEAMKKLIATNPTDPRGWILQAYIHGNCNQFTHCQHGNWYFAPWHRSFVYCFEQLIQYFSKNPGFALPYWDWSRTHSVPATFYGGGNPLDDTVSIRSSCPGAPTAGRGRTVQEQFSQRDLDTYVGLAVVNQIQQNPDFATYGGAKAGGGTLERTPHNFVHRWVGGSKGSNMVQFFSPLDPIFWMHHCNIDRLYSNWLARPGHNPPPESEWRDKSFNDFYDPSGQPTGGQFTCGQTIDSRVMGYVYDRTLTMPAALAEARTSAAAAVMMTSVAASKATVEGGVLAFAADAVVPSETLHLMGAAAVEAGDLVVRLRIEGVKSPTFQNTGVDVFLGPKVTAQTPITAPGYVGSFTFFDGGGAEGGGGGEGHGHHGGSTILLDASEALKKLYGDTSLPEGADITVSFVTRALYDGVERFAGVEEIRPDRIHLDVVKLGR